VLRYVTTNPGKVREAERYLPDGSVERLDFDYPEIQAAELGPIAAQGAREAYRHAGEPVLVDDAGMFVEGLDGFPGPYSSYVEETLGIERVHDIAADLADRRAAFRCVLGYCDGDGFAASPDPVDRGDRDAAAAAAGRTVRVDGTVKTVESSAAMSRHSRSNCSRGTSPAGSSRRAGRAGSATTRSSNTTARRLPRWTPTGKTPCRTAVAR